MNKSRALAAGVMAVLPLMSMSLLAAPAAQAQQYRTVGPAIQGFNVDEVRRLDPGVELPFTLYGTPGGIATIHIRGANRNLTMVETEPGRYEGIYTIGTRDKINPSSEVTANLRVGNNVASSVLSESLLRLPRGENMPPMLAGGPRIERFDVEGNDELGPGNALVFTINGTPGARVRMSIAGARGEFFLPEVQPGLYRGTYTIRREDAIRPDSAVTAKLRQGDRVVSATLGKPLLAGGSAARVPQQRVARYCTNCGTVEAVNIVNVTGDGGYIGAIAGSVVGGLLGNQVGSGSGRTAATVAGAAAGAAAGREIDRNRGPSQRYEVVVRYATNGATEKLTYENDPGFRVGERVRVNDGVLTHDE
jgi:outer membrane lipoprotein SlyB